MPRARTWMSALWTWIAIAGVTASAHGKSEYAGYIPNGNVAPCANCHPGGDTGQQNGFGQDAANQVGKPAEQWWPALADLDSDGDGQTNGQELGDPCNEWLIGLDPGRTTNISNPGDPASKSITPDVPSCGGAGGGGAGGGATTSSTSATTSSGTGGAPPGMSGQGSDVPASTGPGKADPPIAAAGSCATSGVPATSGAESLLFLLALTLFARSRRSHPR